MVRISRALAAAYLTVVPAMPVAAQAATDLPSRIGPVIIVSLLLALALLLGYANFKANQPFGLSQVTSLPPADIIERLIGRYTVRGWRIPSQTDRSATIYRRVKPHTSTAILLFLLGVVPGLIYLLIGGHEITISVTTRQLGDGMTEVEIVGNRRSDGGISIANQVLNNLP